MIKAYYPAQLEDWWLRYACEQFGCNSIFQKEAQIVAAVQSLSDLFTIRRADLIRDYFQDPKLLAAYGLFFFPENFARIQFVIAELLQRGWRPSSQLSVLDLGAGAGAAAMSISQMLEPHSISVKALAVDQSQRSLDVSIQLVKDLSVHWSNLEWRTHQADILREIPKSERKWDVIVMSFALNEADSTDSELRRMVSRCGAELSDNGFLLILEPASQTSSESLERLRDAIDETTGLHIWAPCLHEFQCPLLKTKKFWCHEVRKWDAPAALQYLNRKLQRDISVLKFSFLVLAKKSPPAVLPSKNAFRLISPVTRAKGKWIWQGCASDGDAHDYQLLKKQGGIEIKNWERGDVISAFSAVKS